MLGLGLLCHCGGSHIFICIVYISRSVVMAMFIAMSPGFIGYIYIYIYICVCVCVCVCLCSLRLVFVIHWRND